MKKSSNYNLEMCDGAVIVYRTDRNIGRIAVVFKDSIRLETSYKLPNYILNKAKGMMLPENTLVLKKPIKSIFGKIFPNDVPLLAIKLNDNLMMVEHPNDETSALCVHRKTILYHNCEWLKESFQY